MDPLILIAGLILVALVLLVIGYPLWQQTRPQLTTAGTPGQTLEEYQARYNATLASIKDLMFDFEMGKVSQTDYDSLLAKLKAEAAQLRWQIDRLSSGEISPAMAPSLDAEIETLIIQTRANIGANGSKAMLKSVNTEIEALKNSVTCPGCGATIQSVDAFCASCGTAIPEKSTSSGPQCQQCGYTLRNDDSFCAKCGTPVSVAHKNGKPIAVTMSNE